MSDLLQIAMAGLVIAGYVILWRMDASARNANRIHQAWRRNVAEYKRSISRLKQREADWGNLNQGRRELNARYAETIKARDQLNKRYAETINRMRKHHGVDDAA